MIWECSKISLLNSHDMVISVVMIWACQETDNFDDVKYGKQNDILGCTRLF
jgi:hypothetical protein